MAPKTYSKLTRVNYSGGLTQVNRRTVAADFSEYHEPLARLNHLALLGGGVASGMEATAVATGVRVAAGVAISRKGQLIVLATNGAAIVGEPPSEAETTVPATVPTSDAVKGKRALVVIQTRETLRDVPPSPSGENNFPDGKWEHTPWLRLVPADSFQDNDDLVVLALADVANDGTVSAVLSSAAGVTAQRQRLGGAVGELRFERPDANAAQETTVAVFEPLVGGVRVTSDLVAVTGKLGVGQQTAARPLDVVGSAAVRAAAGAAELVLVSSTPAGGGAVETRDGNGKRMTALTTMGAGNQQAGYVAVGTAGGTELVSLTASPSGGGQIQVNGKTGQAAVVLNTQGVADAGVVRVIAGGQDSVTLGANGITTKGTISAQGLTTQGGISSTGNISTQGSISSAGGLTTAWVSCSGSISASGSVSSSGNLSCTGFLSAQGTVFGGTLQTSGNVFGASFWGKGCHLTRGSAILDNGNNKRCVTLSTTNTTQDGFFETVANAGHPLVRASTTGPGKAWLGLYNPASKVAFRAWVADGGAGVLTVCDANGNNKLWMDGSNGAKNFVLPHPDDPDRQIVYTCLEGPEGGAYYRGRAALKEGQAEVAFPDHFALVANPETVTVQLTPRSADSKGLAVTGQSAGGFRVRELSGATGSYEFDYFVVGVRKGFEKYEAIVPKGFTPLGQPMGEMTPSGPPAALEPPAAPDPTPAVSESQPPAPPAPDEMPRPWGLL